MFKYNICCATSFAAAVWIDSERQDERSWRKEGPTTDATRPSGRICIYLQQRYRIDWQRGSPIKRIYRNTFNVTFTIFISFLVLIFFFCSQC